MVVDFLHFQKISQLSGLLFLNIVAPLFLAKI